MINTRKVYSSLQEAIAVLNESSFERDEEIHLYYYTEENDVIDVLMALGTDRGIGPGSYSIVSTSNSQVAIFTTTLPDVSQLKNGQLYIWTNPETSKNYQVYAYHGQRKVNLVSGELLVSDTFGKQHLVTQERIVKISELATKSELDNLGAVRLVTNSEYMELPELEKSNKDNIFIVYEKS